MALDLVVQKVAPDLRVVSVFVAIAPLHVEAVDEMGLQIGCQKGN